MSHINPLPILELALTIGRERPHGARPYYALGLTPANDLLPDFTALVAKFLGVAFIPLEAHRFNAWIDACARGDDSTATRLEKLMKAAGVKATAYLATPAIAKFADAMAAHLQAVEEAPCLH
jgi:peptidoglycan/xylan/chitin deacetylase (PgdA/CDA1 family)